MNINDITEEKSSVHSLEDIFKHQKDLYLKYKEIEGMDWEGDEVNIHSLSGQKWLKDFLWRVTEEISESYESYSASVGELNQEHTIEELADALHFFVEFCILAGIDHEELPGIELVYEKRNTGPSSTSPATTYWYAVYDLGLIGNTLKNKAWKKHQMKTDVNKFRSLTHQAFISLLHCFFVHRAGPKEIYDYYFRKNKVNQFRQRSNY